MKAKNDTKTLNFRGVDLSVNFDFTPEEPMVMYYKDGSGYDGCPACVDIITVKIGETDVTELLDEHLDSIAERILNEIE